MKSVWQRGHLNSQIIFPRLAYTLTILEECELRCCRVTLPNASRWRLHTAYDAHSRYTPMVAFKSSGGACGSYSSFGHFVLAFVASLTPLQHPKPLCMCTKCSLLWLSLDFFVVFLYRVIWQIFSVECVVWVGFLLVVCVCVCVFQVEHWINFETWGPHSVFP